MNEHIFHTELSLEEIENNFTDFDFFGALMESLNEAAEYAQTSVIDYTLNAGSYSDDPVEDENAVEENIDPSTDGES